MHECVNVQWMNEWMNEWMSEWINHYLHILHISHIFSLCWKPFLWNWLIHKVLHSINFRLYLNQKSGTTKTTEAGMSQGRYGPCLQFVSPVSTSCILREVMAVSPGKALGCFFSSSREGMWLSSHLAYEIQPEVNVAIKGASQRWMEIERTRPVQGEEQSAEILQGLKTLAVKLDDVNSIPVTCRM